MNSEEYIKFINERANKARRRIEELKKAKV